MGSVQVIESFDTIDLKSVSVLKTRRIGLKGLKHEVDAEWWAAIIKEHMLK